MTALVVAANLLPIWAVLIALLVLIAIATLVLSKRVSDTRYTFLAGVGGGIAAVAAFWAIPDDSGVLPFTLVAALSLGAGFLSGRRQRRNARGALGVTAAAAASTLIAAVLAVAITAVSIMVYAMIACSHFVNNCPFD